MNADTFSSLALIFALLVMQFALASVFYSLMGIRKKHLRERLDHGDARARLALELAKQRNVLIATQFFYFLLLALSIVAVFSEDILPLTSEAFHHYLAFSQVWANRLAYLLYIPALTVLMLLSGNQLPHALVMRRSGHIAPMVAPLARLLIWLAYPVTTLMPSLTNRLDNIGGDDDEATDVFEEEIKILVDAGSLEGMIEIDEKDMIYSVFKFGDTRVREVMIPRIDIVSVDIKTSLNEALTRIIEAGHSRLPVYDETIDNIKGFLYAKDILIAMHKALGERDESPFELKDLLRQAYFVPEDKRADELLEEFQTRETHIAIVSDEYGGTAGLVTIEDLLEEIVGEIRDEYDYFEEAPYEAISDYEYICNAGLDLDDLNELLDIYLPTDTNDTLGGYIFSQLGKVPEVGDEVAYNGTQMEVLTVNGRRIEKIRVTKAPSQSVETTNEPNPQA